MPFTVYILYSKESDQYYIGHTADLDDRFLRHTNSGSKFMKQAKDLKIIYTEEFSNRPEAYKWEIEIKKKKSHRYIGQLICSIG